MRKLSKKIIQLGDLLISISLISYIEKNRLQQKVQCGSFLLASALSLLGSAVTCIVISIRKSFVCGRRRTRRMMEAAPNDLCFAHYAVYLIFIHTINYRHKQVVSGSLTINSANLLFYSSTWRYHFFGTYDFLYWRLWHSYGPEIKLWFYMMNTHKTWTNTFIGFSSFKYKKTLPVSNIFKEYCILSERSSEIFYCQVLFAINLGFAPDPTRSWQTCLRLD